MSPDPNASALSGDEDWDGRPPPILGDPDGPHWSAFPPPHDLEEDEPPYVEGPDIRFGWDHGVRVPLWSDGLLPDEPAWLREALGLSDHLIAALAGWGEAMDRLDSSPWSDEKEEGFARLDAEARRLIERLRDELDPRYVVTYEPW